MIETERKRLYTGITTDVARRFREHQAVFERKSNAKGAKYFRSVKPVKVVFVEVCQDRSEASRREIAIKSMSATEKRALINELGPPSGLQVE